MRAVVVSHTYLDPANRGKLRALTALGCTIAVAVPDRWINTASGAPVSATFGDDGGVRFVPIPVRSLVPEGATWRARAIRQLLTDFRPDIVQIEEDPWTQVAAASAIAATSLKIPALIFSWQNLPPRLSPLALWRQYRVLPRLRGVIGGNKAATSQLSRARPGVPSTTIPQLGGLPPLEYHRPAREALSIGFVGRVVPEKGLDLLFRASVKLLGRWSLTVVGSGPGQEGLERLAEQLGIAARISWLGALPTTEWSQLWPSFDVLVVPSRTTQRWMETFSLPVIQAMGHGVTVVASDSGALPELVDTAGLVVPEGEIDALTAALQHLLDSPRERERLGREARQRVMSEYTDDALARKTLEFWERVVGR
ncbi:MAG TPA: glycosyltransferase family 4 protein [Gemmatimonadales bacterium]|nr:glycosyltransferase family 4 protein [Gemmatimonadales bacterium]